MNTRTIFQKLLFLLALRRQSYYHRIKYITSKSASSKYNEISHYYLCLIRELPMYRNTSLDQQSSSGQRYITQLEVTKNQLGKRAPRARRRVFCSLFQQHGVYVLITKPNCRTWGLRRYHQPKQKTWNTTNHSCGPSTAYQTNYSCFSFSNSSSQS